MHAWVMWGLSGDDVDTLDSAESIVIDGANGVTGAPRHHFPDASWSVAIVLAALALTLALRSRVRWVVPVLLLAAAGPGLLQVLVKRADAPLRRGALAAQVASTVDELKARTEWPRPVAVVRDDDDVLFPLGRYAMPTRTALDAGVRAIELRGTRLTVTCRGDAPIICGDAP